MYKKHIDINIQKIFIEIYKIIKYDFYPSKILKIGVLQISPKRKTKENF